jgi:dolichol-phosphate mannosyltransferase
LNESQSTIFISSRTIKKAQYMPLSAEDHLGIVCPMANEGPDAVRFTEQVLQYCPTNSTVTFFAVLDNATKDNSVELLRDYAKAEKRLRVIWAPENRCVVDAYVRGYHEALAAGSTWILEIDAGFSHQPDEVPRFIAKVNEGYDCVFGSRFMPGGAMVDKSLKRYLVSRGGTLLANLLLGTRQTDMTSGFELFSRRALRMILARGIRSRAHFFQTEIKFYCRHLDYIEVPIHYRSPSPRLGSSAIKDAFRQLWQLAKEQRVSQDGKESLIEFEDNACRHFDLTSKSDSR